MLRKPALFLALGASLALVGCEEDPLEPEFAVGVEDFATFDVDRNAFLTEPEFMAGFGTFGVFDSFDADRSAFLEVREFDTDLGAFGDFDLDNDNLLTEEEFLGGTFTAFDTTRDDLIDEDEFGVGLDLF